MTPKIDRLLTLEKMTRLNGASSRRWTWAVAQMTQLLFSGPQRIRVVFEGLDNLPDEPFIIASNHTHTYDALPLRAYLLLRRNLFGSTWIKARAWQPPSLRYFFERTGGVPLVSKGYVIVADFLHMHGRRPNEIEYRALRDHIDQGISLPDEAVYEQIENAPRDILGWTFRPSYSTYRDAVQDCFYEMMKVTLRIARESCEAGQYQHINPQGSRSSRLTEGKPGVIHASRALNLAIVPTAILGVNNVLPNHGLKPKGGAITIRFGEPYMPTLDTLPNDYRPFAPRLSLECSSIIHNKTVELMDKINVLCSENYEYRSDFVSDATSGTQRFL